MIPAVYESFELYSTIVTPKGSNSEQLLEKPVITPLLVALVKMRLPHLGHAQRFEILHFIPFAGRTWRARSG